MYLLLCGLLIRLNIHFLVRNSLMSDRVCLDVRTNDKSGRALNPSLSVTGARGEGEGREG